MPQQRNCDFCGAQVEPGTGTMFVHADGSVVHFCSSKCENNAELGREARNLEWTEAGRGPERTAAAATDETEAATTNETVESEAGGPDVGAGRETDQEREDFEATVGTEEERAESPAEVDATGSDTVADEDTEGEQDLHEEDEFAEHTSQVERGDEEGSEE